MTVACAAQMTNQGIHISELETASDFALLMACAREGAEFVIQRDTKPVGVVRPAEALRGGPIRGCVALADANPKGLGYGTTLDPHFVADL
jgi:hypothetical protein